MHDQELHQLACFCWAPGRYIVNRNRTAAILISALLILVGAGLAFDHRFIPMATLFNSPAFVALVYCPTVIFGVITVFKLRGGQVRSLTAFGLGLIGTGLFHQVVLAESYANPGYMVPIGHIAAPIVSVAAYTASFLGVWAVGKVLERKKGPKEDDADGERLREHE